MQADTLTVILDTLTEAEVAKGSRPVYWRKQCLVAFHCCGRLCTH